MEHSTLGKDTPQVNARAKVLGRAQYAGDIKLPGMLHAKVLRSPYPHAKIVRIDTSAAAALPGVMSVLTGDDCPKSLWGGHHKERSILARDVVRFAGEEVVAIAAVSEEIARDALDLIRVEYDELPALFSPQESLTAGASNIHTGRNNIAHAIAFDKGDVDAGFSQSHLVFEQTYSTHPQYPGYLEPMATLAHIDVDGRLEVWASTQSAFLARARLASALELPVSQIRFHQATTGGGFGGKIIEDANSLVAGLLALKSRKPVRLVNTRLEDFQAACSSLPEQITLKIGMSRDGIILAKEVRIVADCGAYSGLCSEIMHVSAMRSDNMHRLSNIRCHATLAYTHNPPHGAFRGFGGSQMLFALNSHLDTMATKLGLDVVDVHLKNAIERGEVSAHGWVIGSTGLKECIAQCVESVPRARGESEAGDKKRRGWGMATAMHVSGNRTIGNWDGSTVVLKFHEDGRVLIHSGEADMGQGAATMLSQIVAHELTIPLVNVHVVAPDTDISPFCLGALASRVTIAGGNAAIVAASAAREKLLRFGAELLKVPLEQLELANGMVRSKTDPTLSKTIGELAKLHIWREGGEGIQAQGSWDAKTTMHNNLKGNVASAYSFAAQAVEVEVDTETGQVVVTKSFVSDDCGKALNPMAVHGQSNGAAAQAIGWTLYENLLIESGRLTNMDFADYTMPTADALPRLASGIVESNDPNGPYGAKGASETAILPGAPAIANAVFNAIGIRITELPITPEKVLAALRARADQMESARG